MGGLLRPVLSLRRPQSQITTPSPMSFKAQFSTEVYWKLSPGPDHLPGWQSLHCLQNEDHTSQPISCPEGLQALGLQSTKCHLQPPPQSPAGILVDSTSRLSRPRPAFSNGSSGLSPTFHPCQLPPEEGLQKQKEKGGKRKRSLNQVMCGANRQPRPTLESAAFHRQRKSIQGFLGMTWSTGGVEVTMSFCSGAHVSSWTEGRTPASSCRVEEKDLTADTKFSGNGWPGGIGKAHRRLS